ncbi:MAG: type 4a pilus biogenesis protein PilO [Gammaproteobacteria bacterium]|jgi:Tfp pilus assembly protein PilO
MIRQQLIELEPRSLQLILALVAAVVVTGTALYMIKPQYLEYRERRASYEMLQNQIDDPAQLQQAIDQQRKHIGELRLQLHGEAGNMPVNEMESYLVGRLQELAWNAGIELVGVRPGTAKRIIEFEEISFEVEVAGEYKNLYRWLDNIGDALGFMLVTNYEIRLSSRKSNTTELNMHVTIVFYRAVDK